MIALFARGLEWLLEWVLILLMVILTAIVVVAVVFRMAGHSFSWYDEIASVMLAWITYYGAALAALKRGHIGFDTALLAMPMPRRMWAVAFAEFVTIGFFVLMAWTGFQVLSVLSDMYLVSLTWVPISVTQSVIPIGAILFIICELLSLPEYWRKTAAGHSYEHAEIETEIAAAERPFDKAEARS